MARFMHPGVRAKEQKIAEKMAKRAGYKHGGGVSDEADDKKLVKRMVRPGALKRAAGGPVGGNDPGSRLDKKPRGMTVGNAYSHDKGGSGAPKTVTTHPKQKDAGPDAPPAKVENSAKLQAHAAGGRVRSGKVNVIINTNGGGDDAGKLQQAKQEGMKTGAMAVLSKIAGGAGAGGPPGMPPGPPPGAPPMPGAGPVPPPPMRQTGGRVHDPKLRDETVSVRAHIRRKSGGAVA